MLLHSIAIIVKLFIRLGKHTFCRINQSRLIICDHLTNPIHSRTHRRMVGTMVIMIGVVISKLGGEVYLLHLCFDALGYGIHGMGLIPFIANIEKH